jgi:hypothetical protein
MQGYLAFSIAAGVLEKMTESIWWIMATSSRMNGAVLTSLITGSQGLW